MALTARDHELLLTLLNRVAALGAAITAIIDVPELEDDIAALEADVAALEAITTALGSTNATQSADIDAVEAVNATQTADIAAAVAVNVTQTTNIAAAVAVNATQTADIAVLNAMIDPGNDDGFNSFGESSKANNMDLAGYDREEDRLYASGQVIIRTSGDTPTILLARKEPPTDNQTIARFDAVPVRSSDGADVFANGADGASSAISQRWHVPSNGASPQTSHAMVETQVVNELESSLTKPPRTALMVTGENGNEIWAFSYNSSGAVVTSTKIFPRPDVFP